MTYVTMEKSSNRRPAFALAAVVLGAILVLTLSSMPVRADECFAADLRGASDCASSSLVEEPRLGSSAPGSGGATAKLSQLFPSSSLELAAELGIDSYRTEVLDHDSRVRIIAYGDQQGDIASVTYAVASHELEIVVTTATAEWKQVSGVRDNIGYVTRFQEISYYDKVTDQHDTFAVESRFSGKSPASGNQKMLDIGFQFNAIEFSVDVEGLNDAFVAGGKYDSVIQQMLQKHAGPAYNAHEMEIALAVLTDPAIAEHLPVALASLPVTLSAMTRSELRNAMTLQSPLQGPKGSRSGPNGLVEDSVSSIGDPLQCGAGCTGALFGWMECGSILGCAAWAGAIGLCLNCLEDAGLITPEPPTPIGPGNACAILGALPNAQICGPSSLVHCVYNEDIDELTCY